MSEKTKSPGKGVEKVVMLEGTVSREFIYKKKKHGVGGAFKTEDKKLFSKLLITKRITQ